MHCNVYFSKSTSTPHIYTLSLHDALPISGLYDEVLPPQDGAPLRLAVPWKYGFKHIKSIVKVKFDLMRSEEHTSELQSHVNIVCRLLLEKKKKRIYREFRF